MWKANFYRWYLLVLIKSEPFQLNPFDVDTDNIEKMVGAMIVVLFSKLISMNIWLICLLWDSFTVFSCTQSVANYLLNNCTCSFCDSIPNHLLSIPTEHQFDVEVIKAPPPSRLFQVHYQLYIQGTNLCLVNGVPPKLHAWWNLCNIKKFGIIENKFCFEAGKRCEKCMLSVATFKWLIPDLLCGRVN